MPPAAVSSTRNSVSAYAVSWTSNKVVTRRHLPPLMPDGVVEPRWHCPQTCMHTTEHRPTTGRRRNQAATKRSSIVAVLAGLSDPPSTAALVVVTQRLLRHSLLDLGSSGHLHRSSLECQREKHAHVRAQTDHILSCTACLPPPQHITMPT